MNEKLNIEKCTTVAENLFTTGTVEQHILIMAKAMERILQDENTPEIALTLARECTLESLQA